MKLPFNSADFFSLFGVYNTNIWPLHLLVYALGFYIVFLVFSKSKLAVQASYLYLSAIWLINGIGYHLTFFSTINKTAFVFGAMFVLQAVLFARLGWKHRSEKPEYSAGQAEASLALFAYSMIVYSSIGYFSGHIYPNAPVFGVAPCPTTIFTFGILILFTRHLKWYLYLIPLLWAITGTTAAFVLGVREDLGLAAAACVFVLFQLKTPRTVVLT